MDSHSANTGTHRRSISHLPWSMSLPVILVVESMTMGFARHAKLDNPSMVLWPQGPYLITGLCVKNESKDEQYAG